MKEKLNCILLIDDDEPTNFINTIFIEEANCTRHLEIVDGGLKALDYLEKAGTGQHENECLIQPDLVFLDINMPRMNGWEFLKEYKKIKCSRHEKMIIIMLTTSLNPDDIHRVENEPEVAGFENKPLTTAMVKRVIKKHFSNVMLTTDHT